MVYNGLFSTAYYVGPEAAVQQPMERVILSNKEDVERVTKNFPNVYDDDLCTYEWAKKRLETPQLGKVVFAKDHAYALCDKYDLVPSNFVHTFLIRHPHKTLPSLRKALIEHNELSASLSSAELMSKYYAPRYGYGEQHDLVNYLRKRKQLVVIIDADDLQDNPESIIRQYCEAVNIPFEDSYLKWESGVRLLRQWHISKSFLYYGIDGDVKYYETAIKSTHFLPPQPMPSKEDLPEDLLEIIDSVMPHYHHMYEMRLKP